MQEDITTALEKVLATNILGKRVYHYKSVTSTMEIGRRLAREGAKEGTTIIADKQTAGRGRLNRAWLSPENNLYMSIILRPSLGDLPGLIMVASLAVVNAIKKVSGVEARIKWPNDVLINDKKVCGILIENEIGGNTVNFSIIGIGINIELDPSDHSEIASTATSLKYESGKKISRTELVCSVLYEFEKLYPGSISSRYVYDEWCRCMDIVGKSIKVKSGQEIVQGLVEKVTDKGSLILRKDNGDIHEILCGDVTLIKE